MADPLTLNGRMIAASGESLRFDWYVGGMDRTMDTDPQQAPLPLRIGVAGVDGLKGPKRFQLPGMWLIDAEFRPANRSVERGDVIQTRDGTAIYQCTIPGVTADSPDEPIWDPAAPVLDGTATWTWRANVYECLRYLEDLYLGVLGSGILKLYLWPDRFTFAQCVSVAMPDWDGLATRMNWTAVMEAHDPRWQGETLRETVQVIESVGAIWAADTDYTAAAEVLAVTGVNRLFRATNAAKSAGTEPAWVVGGQTKDTAGMEPWRVRMVTEAGMRVLPTVANGCYYLVQTAGTTGDTEPAWDTTPGNTVTDGDVVYLVAPVLVWEDAGAAAATSQTFTVTNAGNAPADCVIHFDTTGTQIHVTIENLDTGQATILAGEPGAAGIVSVDTAEGMVYIGEADRMDLFDGQFISLAPGANRIRITWTEPAPTVITIRHRDAWW